MVKLGTFGRWAFGGMALCAALTVENPTATAQEPSFLQVQAENQVQEPATEPMPETTPPDQTPLMPEGASQFASSQTFSSGLRRPSSSMYDVPNMFGDLFSPGGTISYQTNAQILLIDPAAQATLDPTTLAAVEQQLSQQATQQAMQQIIDQQMDQEGFVDPSQIAIDVELPDLNDAIVPVSPEVVFVSLQGMVDLQLAGGTRRTKIMENNHTLPRDRVSFSYNHFHNAISTDEFRLPGRGASNVTTTPDVFTRRNLQSVNRYTLGFEKTFESGQSSVEFRLPLVGDLQNNPGMDVVSQNGNVGNFSVILKRLFFTAEDFALAAGLGINLPTGSDATGSIGNVGWEVSNEAVHYLPYVGVAGSPGDFWFYQAFAQLDVAGSGNPVDVTDSAGQERVGRLNDQTLLFLDATGGAWLYRNPASRLAGIASILELHYTTTLQDADAFGVVGRGSSFSESVLVFGNANNRLDILNGTVGLHTVLRNGTSFRVGGVFPLHQRDDKRLFDAEVQAAVNVPF